MTSEAFLRIGDGTPFPVSGFRLEMVDRPAAAGRSGPMFAGSLSNVAFGFKTKLSPDAVAFWREVTAGCPVDPDFDGHFADWRCPSCGSGWGETPAGHSWWRDAAGVWSCKQ